MEQHTTAHRMIQAGVLFFRLLQVGAVLLGILLPVGSLMANQSVITFMAMSLFALLLFVFVLIVQVMISETKKRVAPEC